MPIRDVSVLSRIYTPGVGAVCKEIAKNPASSYRYTCRGNSIALISDGSQVYEFGNIGAAAVLPKLEAKSVFGPISGGGGSRAQTACRSSAATD